MVPVDNGRVETLADKQMCEALYFISLRGLLERLSGVWEDWRARLRLGLQRTDRGAHRAAVCGLGRSSGIARRVVCAGPAATFAR